MGGSGLDICMLDWFSGYVLGSGFILGVVTVILEHVLLPVWCLAPLSGCLGVLSAISDVLTDYLSSFYNK